MGPVEHPVALQLGGSEPGLLAQAARIGAELGFDEINLNCGCPSDRVQGGRFGACLMREPALVAGSVAAMIEAVSTLETPEIGRAHVLRRSYAVFCLTKKTHQSKPP